MVVERGDIIARAGAYLAATDDEQERRGIVCLRDALALGYMSSLSSDQIQPVAQGLIMANSDASFQRGVALLAWALGVKDLQPNRQTTAGLAIEPPAPAPEPETEVLLQGRYRVLASRGSDYEVEDIETGRRGVYETRYGGGFRAGMHLRADGHLVDSLGHLEPGWRM